MKRKVLRVPARTTMQYLQLFNGLFELTPKELQILAGFITIHNHLKKAGVLNIDVFGTQMRRKVSEETNIEHLNMYIKKLHDKKAIKKTISGYDINPILIPNGESEIVFQLITPSTLPT